MAIYYKPQPEPKDFTWAYITVFNPITGEEYILSIFKQPISKAKEDV